MDNSGECLLRGLQRGDPLCAVLDDLRAVATVAPAPSARLAELLASGCAPGELDAEAPRRRRGSMGTRQPDRIGALLALLPAGELARRNRIGRLVTASVVALTATVGLTGVAAANDALPEPASSLVRCVVNNVSTFHIDPPAGHDKPHAVPLDPGPRLPGPVSRFVGATLLGPEKSSNGRGSGDRADTGAHPTPDENTSGAADDRRSGSGQVPAQAEQLVRMHDATRDRQHPKSGKSRAKAHSHARHKRAARKHERHRSRHGRNLHHVRPPVGADARHYDDRAAAAAVTTRPLPGSRPTLDG